MTRAARAAYWLTPIAFCIALYWLGIRIWFSQDDFAWLGLRSQVTDFSSLMNALFAPRAQGTIRPFTDRGFFLLFSYFFGLRALPYRLFVFLNQFLNIVLLTMLARKLTRSQLAGFAAPVLWLANISLIGPMSWSSSYNEIQCTTFILASLYLFVRYTETGDRRFYWAQFATFVLGFGALEINVVYPALAAAYAVLLARRYWRSTLPLFGISAIYTIVDRMVASHAGDFYYDMDFRLGTMLWTFSRYWEILLGAPVYGRGHGWPHWRVDIAVAALTAAILAFVVWQTWKRNFLPLFLLIWFFAVLAPLLPLHNHVTDYYLTIPAIGMAILGAYGLALAWRGGWTRTAGAAAVLLIYVAPSVGVIKSAMPAYFDRADRARALVQSVAYAKRIHPGKLILLDNVDNDLFWSAVYDSPFRALGWRDVFMTPQSLTLIHSDPHLDPAAFHALAPSAIARELRNDEAVVYAVQNRQLRNVTREYAAMVEAQPDPPLAASIDLGVPYYDDQVGQGWYALETGFRWSSGHSVVYLPGPASAGRKLHVYGIAPDVQLDKGPVHLTLTIDGRPQPVQTVNSAIFDLYYDLPSDLIGQRKVEVAFTLDRTVHAGADTRNLGLVFGRFSIE